MDNNKQNKNKKQNNNCNDESKKKCEDDLGLASMSYADYILLSSTLAYSLFKDVDEDDLAMLITFFYLVISDLQLLIAQEGIRKARCGNQQVVENEEEEGLDLEPEDDVVISSLDRKSKHKTKQRRYRGKKRST